MDPSCNQIGPYSPNASYVLAIIEKWTQIFILININFIPSIFAFYRQKIARKMSIYGKTPTENRLVCSIQHSFDV